MTNLLYHVADFFPYKCAKKKGIFLPSKKKQRQTLRYLYISFLRVGIRCNDGKRPANIFALAVLFLPCSAKQEKSWSKWSYAFYPVHFLALWAFTDFQMILPREHFAQKYGFTLGNVKLPSDEDGFLVIRPQRPGKIIGVNARRSVEEKRFIIARGFARAELQYTDKKIVLHREHRLAADEKDCNVSYLAGALLMPAESLKRMYLQLKSLNIP